MLGPNGDINVPNHVAEQGEAMNEILRRSPLPTERLQNEPLFDKCDSKLGERLPTQRCHVANPSMCRSIDATNILQ
jgi:hypothetical protein